MGRLRTHICLLNLLLLLLLGSPACSLLHTQLTSHSTVQVTGYHSAPKHGPRPATEDLAIQDSTDHFSTARPSTEDLAERVWTRLTALANTAYLAQPGLGLDKPLDPLHSTSTLKYVHEGELLRLRLLLDNLTLEGLASLSIQEVSFERPGEVFHPQHHQVSTPGRVRSTGHAPREVLGEQWRRDEWPPLPTARPQRVGGGQRRPLRPPLTSVGVIRVAFTQVTLRATYLVRGSAGGFFTFRESGNLNLTAPTIFLTSRVNVTLPQPRSARRRTPPRHSRVKVLWLKTDVSVAVPVLSLKPAAYPPEWVRQQVQTKLEELSSDLSHGHGAVRLLLRRWGKLLKKLIHRTARPTAK